MNKVQKHAGIMVLITMIIFIITACPGNNLGDGVPVKVRTFNNGDIRAANMLRNAAEIKSLAADDYSFDSFYDKLEAKKSSITPTKFVIDVTQLSLISAGWEDQVDAHYNDQAEFSVDFSKENTFTIDEVIADGVTCAAIMFRFDLGDVEFSVPEGFDFESSTISGYSELQNSGRINDGKVNFYGNLLTPQMIGSDILNEELPGVHLVFCGGTNPNVRLTKEALYSDIISDFPNTTMNAGNNVDVVVPFDPVTITSGASSATFHMSWNLDNIVERYEGATEAPEDDIFTLKDGWWNGMEIIATVED
ncbi:MAG: hypothetical protein LBV20_04985 [Treponema sp.]|jgi:hypothetical protein|nr:hypothetical protein [Treponema sp.]